MALWAWMVLPVLLYPLSCDIFSVAKELNVSVSNRNFLSGSHWYVSLVLKALFVIVSVLSRFIPQFRAVQPFQRSQTWCACFIWHTLLPDPRSLHTYECCSYIYTQHPVFVPRTSRLRSTQQGVFGLFCKLLKVRCCGNYEICFHRSERLKCLCIFTCFL